MMVDARCTIHGVWHGAFRYVKKWGNTKNMLGKAMKVRTSWTNILNDQAWRHRSAMTANENLHASLWQTAASLGHSKAVGELEYLVCTFRLRKRPLEVLILQPWLLIKCNFFTGRNFRETDCGLVRSVPNHCAGATIAIHITSTPIPFSHGRFAACASYIPIYRWFQLDLPPNSFKAMFFFSMMCGTFQKTNM